MFGQVRRHRRSSATAIGVLGVIVATSGVVATSAHAEPGNSENAKACQQGGWANLARSEDDSVPFPSQGECVSYGAQGGTIVPYAPKADAQGICEDAGGIFQAGSLWRCDDFSIGQSNEVAVDTALALDAACADDGGRPWWSISAVETVDDSIHLCQPA